MYLIDCKHTFIDWPDDTAIYGALCLFFAGCDFGCKGCHNKQFKDEASIDHSDAYIIDRIQQAGVGMPFGAYQHLIFSGGDPLSSFNFNRTKKLVLELSAKYDITIYTGQEYDFVATSGLVGHKYIKCGKYNINKQQVAGHRDNSFYLASTNQCLVDSSLKIISNNGIFNYSKEV